MINKNVDLEIVGGNFGSEYRESSIVSKLYNILNIENSILVNGGPIENLPKELCGQLNIWMPNISNEEEKHYPIKSKGSVLIVSKVMRDGYTRAESTSRIFKMNGNAVIEIRKSERIHFTLVDALGNVWYEGEDLKDLSFSILRFYLFTKSSVRKGTKSIGAKFKIPKSDLERLIDLIKINNSLADSVSIKCGNRYFGNISTRCHKLFPSMNISHIYVSPRNSDKRILMAEDMIVFDENCEYYGSKKPSVDSPCQVKIYSKCPNIHYLIHGHAFFESCPETDTYYLCGDVREADEVVKLIGDSKCGTINLKNHGFLIYSDTLDNLREEVSKASRGNIDMNLK